MRDAYADWNECKCKSLSRGRRENVPSQPVAFRTCARMVSAKSFAGSKVDESWDARARSCVTVLVTSTRASSTDTACTSSAWLIRMV
jgi:hypothetical protein